MAGKWYKSKEPTSCGEPCKDMGDFVLCLRDGIRSDWLATLTRRSDRKLANAVLNAKKRPIAEARKEAEAWATELMSNGFDAYLERLNNIRDTR